MSEEVQTVVTQKGDRLIDLVKHVYGIREPDRALLVATAVSSATPKNRAAVANKFGLPLSAGVQIEFPPWPEVVELMKALDARKAQVQHGLGTGPTRLASNPMAPIRQVSIGKQSAMPLGERSLGKELARALGLNAQTAVEELRPLGDADADPSRTQSVSATRMLAFGRKLAKESPRAALAELLRQNEKAFEQTLEMMLQKLNPRSFMPNVDTRPTLAVFVAGFFPGLGERLGQEAKLELERRRKLLERGFLRIKAEDLGLPPGTVASRVFGADVAGAFAAVEAAMHTPIEVVAPRVLDQIRNQYGLVQSVHAEKLMPPRAPASMPPLIAFLDAFAPGGDDGPLCQRLFELCTRVSDTHRAAVQQALALTAGLEVDPNDPPNASLAKHLGPLLTTLRQARDGKSPEEQTRLLGDERHLLSGRNFMSFRKDVAVALDTRLTLAVHLTPLQRTTLLLALLMQDGHRLPTMRVEEMDAACERLMQAVI